MCNVSACLPSIPYRVDSRYTLRAIGRWKQGGVLEVRFEGRLMVSIPLPAALWDIVAMMMDAGMRSGGWNWASAFMTAPELARGLYLRSRRGNSDPANIPRYVFRLRNSIAQRMDGRIADPKDWSKLLIEHHSCLGYRIGLPAENFGLEFLGETDDSGQHSH
jgi:hypothetical protein